MPLDSQARRFLERLAATNPPSALSLSVEARREALAQLLSFCGQRDVVGAVTDLTVPGPAGPLTVRTYAPAGTSPADVLPGLVYFHGGGLVAGSLDTHDPVCRSLVASSGCRVLSVDYRLAPEHPFPAAIADGAAATAWISGHARRLGIDPKRLGICGDSAGATLAAVVCQEMTDSGAAQLACQFLLCPILDFASDTESRRTLAQGYLVDRDTLEHDLRYYLAEGGDRTDPRVSPLRAADVSRLPRTLIHTAEFDPLRDEGRAYADRLRGAGVETLYRCHPGMIHLFYGMRGLIAYAGTAFAMIGADIRETLTLPSIRERERR
jgi:acetyl esterase